MYNKENKIAKLTQNYADIILDSVADGVFTVNNEMVITSFNKAAAKITGMKAEEAVGQYCFDVLKSNICETDCPIRFSLNTGQDIIDKHKNILTADGKKVPISLSTSILRDEKGNRIGGVETFRDLSKIEALEKEINKKYSFEDIISKNYKMLEIFDILPNISESNSTVLLQGESGTGKELFARAIHNLSPRKEGPFIAVNCAALPETLLESELFGYVKGAFTDAVKNKPGRFELAKGGTIFLDEIDSMPQITQVKLLRVLQEKEFEPLGAIRPVKANVRVISASKSNLQYLVNEGKFREDLFYRINVVKIELPSLNERRDDIPLLINHFIKKFNHHMHKSIKGISPEVLKLLLNLSYKGNIRQLENIIEHAFVMCPINEIQIDHMPPELISDVGKIQNIKQSDIPLEESERRTISEILIKHNGDTLAASKELRIHRATLYRKIKKYNIT